MIPDTLEVQVLLAAMFQQCVSELYVPVRLKFRCLLKRPVKISRQRWSRFFELFAISPLAHSNIQA